MRAGAVLAVLDTRTLALQADQARAQMDAQQQTLLRLRNGSRPEEIAQARSRLVAAQADAARASRTWRGCAASPPTRKGAASAPRTWTAPAAPRRWPRPRRTNSAKRCAWPRQARARKTSLAPRPSCRPRRPAGAAAAPDLARRTESARRRRGALAPAGAGRHGHAAAAGLRAGAGAAVGSHLRGRGRPGQGQAGHGGAGPDRQPARQAHRRQGRLHLVGGRVHAQGGPDRGAAHQPGLRVRVRVDDPQDALRLGQPATVRMAADAAQ